ncbi:MAG: helix-turn-helix domain-containing protein [Aeromonas sp.]
MTRTKHERSIQVGKRVRELREEADLTLGELGQRIGMGVSRISNWEQGLRQPGLEEIEILSAYFRVSPGWIAGFSDQRYG